MSVFEENWLNLKKTSTFQVVSQTEKSATIVVEPLEKGYGVTIGNALRRILMLSIGGFAVTSVKIDGVFHEFDLISGVKEDIYDIIMNIKSLIITKKTSTPGKILLKTNKKGVIFARDLVVNGDIDILNKDLYVCSIEKDGVELNMEMNVEYGIGYVPAVFHDEKKPIGLINIDAVFNPIRRVMYKVSPTRIGQKIGYDKLEISVETNGTISAIDVFSVGAKILQEQLDIFIKSDLSAITKKDKENDNIKDVNLEFLKKIDEMELSARSFHCLKQQFIDYVGDLVLKTEEDMLKLPNFGKKSLNELKDSLSSMGLSFGMKIDNWEKIKKENKEK